MFWFMIIALVVVVAAVALVVLGAGGSLPEAASDRTRMRLPDERALTRGDIDGVRFAVAPRGYRMDEVDALLDRLGAELDLKDARLRAAEDALAEYGAVLPPVPGIPGASGAAVAGPARPVHGDAEPGGEAPGGAPSAG